MSKTAKRASVSVRVVVQTRPQRLRVARCLTMTSLLLAAIGATGGIWIALQAIVNPGAIRWLSWVIPGWDMLPLTRQTPQTLAQIRAATEADLRVGQPIYLSTYPGFSKDVPGFNDFLLPIHRIRPGCSTADIQLACESLVEIRAYRLSAAPRLPGDPVYDLIDRVVSAEPEELLVIAPLIEAGIIRSGSSRRIPFTALSFIPGRAPLPGAWLHLSGTWQRGNTHLLYGQVVRYDPQRGRLQLLQSWTSPAEEFPIWRSITGDAASELVVNRTLGLEPEFQVYQFQALDRPGHTIHTQAITLTKAVLADGRYRQGLLLARNRLWSPALDQFQQSKAQSDWNATAQAQLDLIALHAQVTQANAQRDWSNPRQQVMALLMDGQWSAALRLIKTAHQNGYSTTTLLTDQSDRLWQRVEAALRVQSQLDVLSWGVLLTAVRQDRATAISWLQQRSAPTKPTTSDLFALLDPLPEPSVVATTTTSTRLASETGQSLTVRSLLGIAQPVEMITPENWLPLNADYPLVLAAGERWYEVDIMQVQNGQTWQSPEWAHWTAAEWTAHLGLRTAPLEVITWSAYQPQAHSVTVKAVQLTNGTLRLLAAGTTSIDQQPLLVTTADTLTWLNPIATLTLTDFGQPDAMGAVSALWQELQQSGYLPTSVTTPAAMLWEFGDWSVQQMELTGDVQPELIFTFQTKSAAVPEISEVSEISTPTGFNSNESNLNSPLKTLILTPEGTVLYSNLQTEQTLRAIADMGDEGLPVLVISDAQGYQLGRWSEETQQFEFRF